MIVFHDVSHSYQGKIALQQINLELPERKIGIIGANGSGKSTLARMINGLIFPQQGQVFVNGVDVRKKTRAVRHDVGFIFSDADNQIIMPTVGEDIAIGLKQSGLSKSDIHQEVSRTLDKFGLADYHDHPAHFLSSGQKQMLALASVMVTSPKILVCDEPTTLLDLRNTQAVVNMLNTLPQQIILLTHQLESLVNFDRVLVIDNGHVVCDDVPEVATNYYTKLMSQGD